jgi:hypothetical protein
MSSHLDSEQLAIPVECPSGRGKAAVDEWDLGPDYEVFDGPRY